MRSNLPRAKRKKKQSKIMRSNLPLWLALAFHELSPAVAILVWLWSQPYQWRDAFAVRTWQHGHWTMLGPRGEGGWTRERHISSPEKKNRRRRIAEERGDNGGRARASLCVGGEGGWLGPTIGRTRLFSAANQVAGTNLSRIAIGILLEDRIWGLSFGARVWSDG